MPPLLLRGHTGASKSCLIVITHPLDQRGPAQKAIHVNRIGLVTILLEVIEVDTEVEEATPSITEGRVAETDIPTDLGPSVIPTEKGTGNKNITPNEMTSTTAATNGHMPASTNL